MSTAAPAGRPTPAQRTTLRDVLADAAARLGSVTEARWVLEQASGLDPAGLAARLGDPAGDMVCTSVDELVDRRLAGEPLQYVLGSWQFRTLLVAVDARVLIPRPETETVAGLALDQLADAR